MTQTELNTRAAGYFPDLFFPTRTFASQYFPIINFTSSTGSIPIIGVSAGGFTALRVLNSLDVLHSHNL